MSWACRDAVRKAKAHLELRLARGLKGNSNSFHRYIGRSRETEENAGPRLHGAGELVRADTNKAGALDAFSASAFAKKDCQCSVPSKRVQGGGAALPAVGEDQIKECFRGADPYGPMGPGGLHPRVPRELADVFPSPPSSVLERSWRFGAGS